MVTKRWRSVVVSFHIIRRTGGAGISLCSFLTLSLDGVNGQLHSLGKNPSTCGIGGWVDPRGDVDIFEKEKYLLPLLGFEARIVQPIV
jgi:hypothetical protein